MSRPPFHRPLLFTCAFTALAITLTRCAAPPATPGEPARAASMMQIIEHHTSTAEVRRVLLHGHEVWAATGGGVAVFDRQSGTHLRTLTAADGLPGNDTRTLAPWGLDRVVVGGSFGAAVVRAQMAMGPQRPPPAGAVTPLGTVGAYDPLSAVVRMAGQTWLIRGLGGVEVMEQAWDGHLRTQPVPAPTGVWAAAAAAPEGLWLGGHDGTLVLTDERGKVLQRMRLPWPVMDLSFSDGVMFLATGERLQLMRGGSLMPITDESGAQVPASALAEDQAGNRLLVATGDGRVMVVSGERALLLHRLEGRRLTALAADGDRVFVGVAGAGLHLLELGEMPLLTSLRPAGEICGNHVTHVTRHAGRVVAGTFDQGACALSRAGWVPLGPLPSPMVLGLASDGEHLYVATTGGLARFDEQLAALPFSAEEERGAARLTREVPAAAAELGGRSVALVTRHAVTVLTRAPGAALSHQRQRFPALHHVTNAWASHGRLWLGTERDGAVAMPLGAGTPQWLQDPDVLPEAWVTAVSSAEPDDVWVGTCQKGVVHVSAGRARVFAGAEGLRSPRVTAVWARPEGAMVGTLLGLSWVDAHSGAVASYGVEDGLPDPRVSMVRQDGNIWWVGTEAGLALLAYNP